MRKRSNKWVDTCKTLTESRPISRKSISPAKRPFREATRLFCLKPSRHHIPRFFHSIQLLLSGKLNFRLQEWEFKWRCPRKFGLKIGQWGKLCAGRLMGYFAFFLKKRPWPWKICFQPRFGGWCFQPPFKGAARWNESQHGFFTYWIQNFRNLSFLQEKQTQFKNHVKIECQKATERIKSISIISH